MFLAGLLAVQGCAAQPMTVASAAAMNEANLDIGERTPQLHFSLKDEVKIQAYLTWPDPTSANGTHDVAWNWYRNGILVSRGHRDNLEFLVTPYALWSTRPAAALGSGSYTVDIIVDGKVVASPRFTIDAG